jgi:hypothetical protein
MKFTHHIFKKEKPPVPPQRSARHPLNPEFLRRTSPDVSVLAMGAYAYLQGSGDVVLLLAPSLAEIDAKEKAKAPLTFECRQAIRQEYIA